LVPDIGAKFAAEMGMMQTAPAITIKIGQRLSQGPEISINPCSTRYGNAGKSKVQYDVIMSNYR
jgi:hypothetical protein